MSRDKRSCQINKNILRSCFLSLFFCLLALVSRPGTAIAGNFEVGSVALNNTLSTPSFTTVTFTNTYATTPVVFAMATSDGSQPCSIRIKNVTTTGCDMCQVEPDNQDGGHVAMTVHYLAIETGTTILPNGDSIYVTTHDTQTVQCATNVGCTAGWDTVAFPGVGSTPAVITQIQTMVNETGTPPSTTSTPWLTVAASNVTTSSVDVALERAEVATGVVSSNETIGIAVMEGGLSGTFTDGSGTTVTYESIVATSAIQGWANGCFDVSFTNTYTTTPLVMASMNSRNGNNGGWLRRCDLTTSYVGLTVDEDQYYDSDRSHILEDAGVLVFSLNFDASGVPDNPTVAISEVGWMGTYAYPEDEWIELYNNTTALINLSAWTLAAKDGTPNIALTGTIAAKSYYLLERDDDWTISNLTADQIYTGELQDTGEQLELKNSGGTLIDVVNPDGGGWPGGSTFNYASLERVVTHNPGTDDNWQTSDGTVQRAKAADGDLIRGNPLSPSSPPEAGRALDLDGIDDFVSVNDTATLDLSSSGTLEAWIKVSTFSDNATIIAKGDSAADEAYVLKFGAGADNKKLVLTVNDGTNSDTVTSTSELMLHKWYHVAGTWDNTAGTSDLVIYINGISDNTGDCRRNAQNASGKLRIGARYATVANPFTGSIDEVRVWNTARSASDIQNNLCLKLSGAETGIVAYWRFDHKAGNKCTDFSDNQSNGTMTNMTPATARVTSGAPLGDDMTADFSSPSSIFLASSLGDRLTVKSITGSPTGVVIYRVDMSPGDIFGPVHWRLFENNSHFFGVFMAGGTDPTYTAEYNYTGIPLLLRENRLKMAYRHRAGLQWIDSDATLDTGANTLTKTGQTGTEYILGQLVDPRNAIDYDGADDYVTVPDDATLDLDNSGTLEAWIYADTLTANAGILLKGTTAACYGFGSGGGAAGTVFNGGASSNIGFVVGNTAGGNYLLTGSATLTTGQWYHVACVWSNTAGADSMTIYIDGVQDTNSAANIDNASRTNNEALEFGRQAIDTIYFDGKIDDIRVWNTARTQAQIQDAMCRKLTGSESGLVGYWRFDEESSSTTCLDQTANNNNGVMTNFADVATARTCSEAPIGDACAYDFTGTAPGDFTASIAHVDGDFFTATGDGGTWSTANNSGIEVYRLDEPSVYPPDIGSDPYLRSPNGLTPPAGWSSLDYTRYWGVFVTGGVTPTYTAVYDYGNNPMTPVDDSVVGLATRSDYCQAIWSDSGATLDTTGNTLTTTGQSGTEYVFGGAGAPLAITLAAFSAAPCADRDCIEVTWTTSVELDTLAYRIWRSDNEDGPYGIISPGMIYATGANALSGETYTFTDNDISAADASRHYYKLESIPDSANAESEFYGPVNVAAPKNTRRYKSSASVDTPASENHNICFISVIEW
ncbi:MAG: hypothetical protein GXP53_09910 [Deltaproteobacteria bacterium]|nr:hypothetical protein [Deltaproteobacteria bacterium]